VEQTASEATVTLRQAHPQNRVFPCVVDVQLTSATKAAIAHVDFGPSPSSPTATAKVSFDEPVVSVQIDPERRVLAWPTPLSTAPLSLPSRVPFHP
jgi:hypothetical protein